MFTPVKYERKLDCLRLRRHRCKSLYFTISFYINLFISNCGIFLSKLNMKLVLLITIWKG